MSAPLRLVLPDRAIPLPAECACCGELSSVRSALEAPDGRSLLVGYCEACAAHGAREQTRWLTARLASGLIGLTLGAGLPLLFPKLGLLACMVLVFFGAAVPFSLLLRRTLPDGHTAHGKALWFDRDSALVCSHPDYATKIATELGISTTGAAPPRRMPFELLLPLGCVLLTAPIHRYLHPALRVINANTETIEVFVDAESLGLIEPSGAESPSAGLSIRVPAGVRRLRARTLSGSILADTHVTAHPGNQHLFAPGANRTCFWLERAGYGRNAGDIERLPLTPSGERFWSLAEEIEGWFVPLPPHTGSSRTTGGTVTVLRQGTCDEMP